MKKKLSKSEALKVINDLQKEDNLKTIELIKGLKKGWNCYDADPISLKVCENAINFINNVILQPQTFPVACNSIQCEYEDDTTYLEFEIFETYIKIYISIQDKDGNRQRDIDIQKEIKLDDYNIINELIKKYYDTESYNDN